MLKENEFEYLKSWSEELSSRADRVRLLIGSRHWLTDGHHKEVIVRDFLARYLPNNLEIGSGFIKPLNQNICSPEVDVLISNPVTHPAFFNEGGIQIVPPSAAVAYIEMKSTYNTKSLKDALCAVGNTQIAIDEKASDVWRCICFCTLEAGLDKFCEDIEKYIKIIFDELNVSNQPVSSLALYLPTCIASFGAHVVFLRVDEADETIILNAFHLEELSAATAFGDLLEHIRYRMGSRDLGDLSEYITNLSPNGFKQWKFKID